MDLPSKFNFRGLCKFSAHVLSLEKRHSQKLFGVLKGQASSEVSKGQARGSYPGPSAMPDNPSSCTCG